MGVAMRVLLARAELIKDSLDKQLVALKPSRLLTSSPASPASPTISASVTPP